MKKYASFPELIEDKCVTHHDIKILSFLTGDQCVSWTYHQLGQRVRSIANHIQMYCKPGERILILLPPSLDYIAAFLACLYARCLAIPLYPPRNNREDHRVTNIFKDAECHVAIITSDKELDCLKNFRTIKVDEISTEEIKFNKKFKIKPEDIAFLQYTSGSTSSPKGVMVTHKNLLENCQAMEDQFYQPNLISCSWLPLYHDMGLIGGILFPLYSSFSNILFSPHQFIKEPLFWLKTISKFKVNITAAPNFAYDLCAKELAKNKDLPLDLTSLKIALNGSEPVNAKTIQNFFIAVKSYGVKKDIMFPCYGLAEATLFITSRSIYEKNKILHINKNILKEKNIAKMTTNKAECAEFVSCGKILKRHQLVIVNPDSKIKQSAFHVGEIWVRGSSITKGYWKNELETREIYHASLKNSKAPIKYYLRTGDLGFIDNDKKLYIIGRIKDLIIIRGKNYYPSDIEYTVQNAHSALISHGGAALGIQMNGQEYLAIVHEVKRHTRDFNDIFTAIQNSVMREYEIPVDKIVLIQKASLAKTSSGKIKRFACKQALEKNTLKTLAIWQSPRILSYQKQQLIPPVKEKIVSYTQDQIIAWLTHWIKENLDLDSSVINSNMTFIQLGLDSVYLVRLMHEVKNEYDIEIEPEIIWENPTIKQIAKLLEQQMLQKTSKKSIAILPQHAEITKEEAKNLLRKIDELSEEEIKSLLKILKSTKAPTNE
jgi:acyl-CoA synthetase (AMP-forming)/AMP-acid ligase II/acyl carrier protein